MMPNRLLALTSLLTLGALVTAAAADAPDTSTIEALKRQIQELDQKVRVLERKREIDQEAADTKAKEAPVVTVGDKGFSFASADKAFELKLRGLLQTDARFFVSPSNPGDDGFLLRRVRPILQGTLYYVLTGEDATYRGATPLKPFRFGDQGWGALEAAARLGGLTLDSDLFPNFADATQVPRQLSSWGLGLNWYLNKNLKAQLSYDQTDFDGGNLGAASKDTERVILTRLQVAF